MGQQETKEIGNQRDATLSRIPSSNCIERVETISPEDFLEKYYKKGKPVIITKMMNEWPVMEKWTLDYIKQEIGDKVHTFHYENSATFKMTVGEYIDIGLNLNKEESKKFKELPSMTEKIPYVRHFGPLSVKAPKLQSDIEIQKLFPNPNHVSFREFIFVGVSNTKTNLHYDDSNNFVAIAVGQKHITLLPPHSEKDLNLPDEAKQKLADFEAHFFPDPDDLVLDISKIETEKSRLMHEHPVFTNSKTLLYSPLYEGDIVFIPQQWYHYVHNVDMSVSITIQTTLLK